MFNLEDLTLSVDPLSLDTLQRFPWLTGLGSVVVCLLIWRLWRFTIAPLLYPGNPKELPYWIPCKSVSEWLIPCWVY